MSGRIHRQNNTASGTIETIKRLNNTASRKPPGIDSRSTAHSSTPSPTS